MGSYVDFDGQQISAHPVECKGAVSWFLFWAEKSQLQSICDTLLNLPSGGAVNYRPLFPMAAMTYADLPEVRSVPEPYADMGSISEREVAFWILIGDGLKLAWLNPFVFVDNPYALAAGREIYGFRKQLAWLSPWGENGPPDVFSVKTTGFQPYSRGTRSQVHAILTLTKTQSLQPDLSTFGSLSECFSHLAKSASEVPSPDYSDELKKGPSLLKGQPIPFVNLRQLRDGEKPLETCYQAVVETPVTLSSLKVGVVPAIFELDVTHLDSHKVQEVLGLRTNLQGQIRTILSYRAEMEFTLGLSRTLWQR